MRFVAFFTILVRRILQCILLTIFYFADLDYKLEISRSELVANRSLPSWLSLTKNEGE